ncbi:hypothetical protein M404DRAFT_25802 [Pisolithus tinctorius Marx 270]|uniref:Uncharacterized protein n=1 Tax=Pisolithus tinctorius Marx 270 TaxID=870435 RepID=A0A0C3PB60_PISTI|nr:hypothetical protein M404DRAFT_25802 [Pisolithus tinctorius Marx 270]
MAVLFVIRTYALYGRNKRILAFLLFTTVALVSVVAEMLQPRSAIHLAVPYEALYVFDTLIFGLTAYKTFKVGIRSIVHSKPKLVVLLLRDGAIYFAIVAMANLANILSFYVAPEHLKGGLSTISICTAVTMVSRLMLNLHKTADAGIFSHGQHLTDGRGGAIFTSQFLEPDQGWDLSTPTD